MRRPTRFAAGLACAALVHALAGAPVRADEAPTWIVVPAPAFAEAVKPLAAHRRAEGFRVVEVDLAALRARAGTGPEEPLPLRVHLRRLCREAGKDCSVLLVGSVASPAGEEAAPPADAVVPSLRGTVERMRGEPTDDAYGSLDDDRVPEVAVGRFPARTVDDARTMVEKTLAFESRPPGEWRDRLTLLVGNPGGSSPLERRFAANVVENEVAAGFRRLHPRWSTRALVHVDSSPFAVPDDALASRSLDLVRAGQLVVVYLGHSGPGGLWSDGREFLTREDWRDLVPSSEAGVLLSCGCHACRLGDAGDEGYGIAAVRSARGPVAAIGAHGSSHGVCGKLAFEGLLPHLSSPAPPARLGAWYLAMKRGIAEGPVSALTFWLYDQADGSGGKVPLEVQREEHLEMWTLLGDPALRLPVEPPEVEMEVAGPARPGRPLEVRGSLPERLAEREVAVEVAVERAFGTLPADLAPLPATRGEERDAALLLRHERANARTEVLVSSVAAGGRFRATLDLPPDLPGDRVVVRARVVGDAARGAADVPLERRAP